MKLSVCINSVTGNMPRTEAMRLSKKLGYSAVEFWEGKDCPVADFGAILKEAGLDVACMGFATGLVDPAIRADFLAELKASLANAKVLGAKCIIAATGQELTDVSRAVQHESIVEGLKEAAKIMEGTGVILVLEPLNILINHKGYYLDKSDEAFEIVRKVGSPSIKVLFDIYHQQISEGNLIANITENIDLIGHFHIAGNPGRNEPYLGEINYPEIFKAIEKAGYAGYVGLEYWSQGDMEESLVRCLEMFG